MELTENDHKRLRELQHIAIDLSPVAGSRVAAGLRYKNEWIAFGWNSKKTHPLQGRFGNWPHLHAEIDVLVKAKSRLHYEEDLYRKCELYVARAKMFGGKWGFGCAKPCEGCQRALEWFGVRKIVWSKEEYATT